MKIRNVLGLATLGGILYLHKRRGGELTIESFKDSARELWRGIQRSADRARAESKQHLREAAAEVERVAHEVGERAAHDGGERTPEPTGYATGSTGGGNSGS